MTPDEQRIAIAEACGWKVERRTIGLPRWNIREPDADLPAQLLSNGLRFLPDYLNDLNAMHEAEKVIFAKGLWNKYWDKLIQILPRNDMRACYAGHATAAQRAEAFIRTLNLRTDRP